MKIDPTLIKGFKISLFYGIGALLYFHFFGKEQAFSDNLFKAAATAGIFLLIYYVTARVLRQNRS